MTLKDGAFPRDGLGKKQRRPWTAPRTRRLATSDAENSTGLGPDAETVVS